MPELPEVEGFRAFLDRHLTGRTIVRARALDDWMLKDVSPRTFARRLEGRPVTGTARKGKIVMAFAGPLDVERDPPALVLHFGMTGHPLVEARDAPVHRWDRMMIDLDDGTQVRYRNMRRLGFIRVMPQSHLPDLLWALGPDPLEAPASWLRDALRGRRAPVKAVLLDQGFMAGVGNIYADEALHAAGIRPGRPANSLSEGEAKRLHGALRRVLTRAVRAQLADAGRELRLRVPRRRDEPCPRCGRPIRALQIGGRTSYYCPVCQR